MNSWKALPSVVSWLRLPMSSDPASELRKCTEHSTLDCQNHLSSSDFQSDGAEQEIHRLVKVVPSVCRQLLGKTVLDSSGKKTYPYIIQMHGSKSPFYIGCPVEVQIGGNADIWVKGMISNLATPQLNQSVILHTGSTVEVDVGKIRQDVESCGRLSVGRHVQVLFEGGTWYIGIIVKLERGIVTSANNSCGKRKSKGPTRLRIVFEDGDRIEAMAEDNDVILLPSEWSEHVAEAGFWGWWGFNKERLKNCSEHNRGNWNPIPTKHGGSPKHFVKNDVNNQAIAGSSTIDNILDSDKTLPILEPDIFKRSIKTFVVQMQGSTCKYYTGCPVEVWEQSTENWMKGTVLCQDGGEILVGFPNSENVRIDYKLEDRLRADRSSCGKFKVGRHAQVLFADGVWYVGIVVALCGGSTTSDEICARMFFEDGTEELVNVIDEEVLLLPEMWSDAVARLGPWGWWGFNMNRVKLCKVAVRSPPPTKQVPIGRGRRRSGPSRTNATAKRQLETDSSALVPGAKRMRKGPGRPQRVALPPTPPPVPEPPDIAGPPQFRPFMVPKAIASFCKSNETLAEKACKMESDEEEDDDHESMSASPRMNSLALAITLCDSLWAASFVDEWYDGEARSNWKERIGRRGGDLRHFAVQLRIFESKLAQSATMPAYVKARPIFLETLKGLKDEEVAKHCVQLLAGHINGVLYRSESQRALCCGPYLRSAQ